MKMRHMCAERQTYSLILWRVFEEKYNNFDERMELIMSQIIHDDALAF